MIDFHDERLRTYTKTIYLQIEENLQNLFCTDKLLSFAGFFMIFSVCYTLKLLSLPMLKKTTSKYMYTTIIDFKPLESNIAPGSLA